MAMKAKDIMTRRVISGGPEASIRESARLMLQHRVSGLPVIAAAGRLVGVVTEGDFLRRVEAGTELKRPRWLEFMAGPGRLATEYVHSHGRKVADVMTGESVTVGEDTPIEEVVRLMEERRIKRLPVMRGTKWSGSSAAPICFMRSPASRPGRHWLLRTIRRSATAGWTNLRNSRGRHPISLTSLSAMEQSNCGASSPPTVTARRRRQSPRISRA